MTYRRSHGPRRMPTLKSFASAEPLDRKCSTPKPDLITVIILGRSIPDPAVEPMISSKNGASTVENSWLSVCGKHSPGVTTSPFLLQKRRHRQGGAVKTSQFKQSDVCATVLPSTTLGVGDVTR